MVQLDTTHYHYHRYLMLEALSRLEYCSSLSSLLPLTWMGVYLPL